MNKTDLLKKILEFLNTVPNRKYGDNYQLCSELSKYIKEHKKLEKQTIAILKSLRLDAQMALDGDWDPCTDEGKEGFQCQIDSINNLLFKIKNQ
jgi:hypothetical protein